MAANHAADHQEQPLIPSGEQMEHDRDAAEFGGAGDEVQQIGGDQRGKTQPKTKTPANDCEYRLPGDSRHTSAHFHANNDRRCAQND